MLSPSPVTHARQPVHLRHMLFAPVIAAVLLCVASAPAALAAPGNDAFESATTVSALPFSDTVDLTVATVEAGEPQSCSPVEKSVWYAITPTADGMLSASTSVSAAPAQLNVYRQDGSGLSGLSFLTCQNFGFEPAVFSVEAGTTYYVQGSTFFWGDSQLHLEIKAVTAPANDDFADATAIGSLPFSDRPVLSVASFEAGEPSACVGANQKTVWYAFTPAEAGSYVVERSGGPNPLAVHTGSALTSLHEVACAGFSSAVFRADAGTTYFIQLGAGFFASSPIELSVRVAPPAMASFFYYPSDPSSLDTVQFHDMSWDVAQIASRLWGFGDGATATDCCPSHRYAADGEYEAKLAITTTDGRSASATRNVAVETHDVAITKLSVPKTGHVGQSREITVGVQNTRYAETVEVALLRSTPGGGFEPVGQVTKDVPAREKGRTTTFSMAYTVTPADATLGKVTFQAVATIVGARDANPADNTITALPTKVAR